MAVPSSSWRFTVSSCAPLASPSSSGKDGRPPPPPRPKLATHRGGGDRRNMLATAVTFNFAMQGQGHSAILRQKWPEFLGWNPGRDERAEPRAPRDRWEGSATCGSSSIDKCLMQETGDKKGEPCWSVWMVDKRKTLASQALGRRHNMKEGRGNARTSKEVEFAPRARALSFYCKRLWDKVIIMAPSSSLTHHVTCTATCHAHDLAWIIFAQ